MLCLKHMWIALDAISHHQFSINRAACCINSTADIFLKEIFISNFPKMLLYDFFVSIFFCGVKIMAVYLKRFWAYSLNKLYIKYRFIIYSMKIDDKSVQSWRVNRISWYTCVYVYNNNSGMHKMLHLLCHKFRWDSLRNYPRAFVCIRLLFNVNFVMYWIHFN